jgi:hypothetical protein
MKINYKQPYWVKFNWEIDSHHENQYVTEFNKHESDEILNFQHLKSYTITCDFKIDELYKTDKIFMIFGKPGKNLGLAYNTEAKVLSFEFWTTVNGEDKFNYLLFKDCELNPEFNTATIIRENNEFKVFLNFKEVNSIVFEGELIEDYKQSEIFLGCGNPGSPVEEHRYYGEVDVNHFSVIKNSTTIVNSEAIYKSKDYEIIKKRFYSDILFFYDFETINNIGIVYDNSKNTHFLEKVTNQFVL